MTNAKDELLEIVGGFGIKCGLLKFEDIFREEENTGFSLRVGHSKSELQAFLESLNFEYDAGFGSQMLSGIVWLNDGTWLERGEYDGSEWWEHKKLPNIPADLIKEMGV